MKQQKTINILLLENVTNNYDKMTSSTSDTSWIMILLDRSQQVMTVIGVIANIGTSITLIKNGQVSLAFIRFQTVLKIYVSFIMLNITHIKRLIDVISGLFAHNSVFIGPSVSNRWRHMSMGNAAASSTSQLGPVCSRVRSRDLSYVECAVHLLVLCARLR